MQKNERVLGPTTGKPRGAVWGETGDSAEWLAYRGCSGRFLKYIVADSEIAIGACKQWERRITDIQTIIGEGENMVAAKA